jgi:hypothetical protein
MCHQIVPDSMLDLKGLQSFSPESSVREIIHQNAIRFEKVVHIEDFDPAAYGL